MIGAKPLELHSHCTIGLGELVYMDAVDYGVSALQCASGAVADGISNPPSLRVVQNLRALGHTVPVDTEALTEVNHFFTRIAQAEGLPSGAPQAFDAAYLRHQLPGGMIGTMRRQLAERRLAHLEGDGHRGDRARARGARLADRHDAVLADTPDAGGAQRDRARALRGHAR